jgi:hypothetical protein
MMRKRWESGNDVDTMKGSDWLGDQDAIHRIDW